MNETQIGDIWLLFAEYIDAKQIGDVAERYIDLLADQGVGDRTFQNVHGIDRVLDHAIDYYLESAEEDADSEEDFEDED